MDVRRKRKCGGKVADSIQHLCTFRLSTSLVFLHNSLLPCKAACSLYKRPPVQSCGHHAGWIQYNSTAPYWAGGQFQPPTEITAGPRSHLCTKQGARSGLAFSNSGNHNTNEKSVNQRVTRGQEDSFDTLLQLQSSLSLQSPKTKGFERS